jgi:integrase
MSTRNIHPLKARRDFIRSKRGVLKESTIRCYEFVVRDFVEYVTEEGIERTHDIDGWTVQQWKLKRKDRDEVSPITPHNNVKHLRVFLKWCEASELVEQGLYEKVEVPPVTDEQRRSNDALSPQRAESIPKYLEQYEYATRIHAVFSLMWETGCRISAVVALDIDDYDALDSSVTFLNRKETGTPLKNGNNSERKVELRENVIEVLNDYISARRVETTDEYSREPLFTTPNGRMWRQRAYKDYVGLSRPCVYDGTCPHDRDQGDCTAATKKKQADECPSSGTLHAIRHGSITAHLNGDWPVRHVSERCDVSAPVLKKHYDTRTMEDKRQTRRKYIDRSNH